MLQPVYWNYAIKLTKPGTKSKSEDDSPVEADNSNTTDHENLSPAADGIQSTGHTDDHDTTEAVTDQEDQDHVDNDEEDDSDDDNSNNNEINDSTSDHVIRTNLTKNPLNISDIDNTSMSFNVEHQLDCQITPEHHQLAEDAAPEDPKLKLTLPNSSTEPEDWEPKPKEYMDDGEEVRERRPGFQDLGNCKRFWKAQQLIGTRKHKDQVWACQLF